MYPLAMELGIGYTLWPWKKMACDNSPFSINKPDGWKALIEYAKGGPKPAKEEAINLLDTYLENMKLENCTENSAVNNAVFRRSSFTLRGSDFDQMPGKGVSYSGSRSVGSPYGYQQYTGMSIVPAPGVAEGPLEGWAIWNNYCLELTTGEYACYTAFDVRDDDTLVINLYATRNAALNILQDDTVIAAYAVNAGRSEEKQSFLCHLSQKDKTTIKIEAESGTVTLDSLSFVRK